MIGASMRKQFIKNNTYPKDTLTGMGVEKAKVELAKGRSIVEIVGDYGI